MTEDNGGGKPQTYTQDDAAVLERYVRQHAEGRTLRVDLLDSCSNIVGHIEGKVTISRFADGSMYGVNIADGATNHLSVPNGAVAYVGSTGMGVRLNRIRPLGA